MVQDICVSDPVPVRDETDASELPLATVALRILCGSMARTDAADTETSRLVEDAFYIAIKFVEKAKELRKHTN